MARLTDWENIANPTDRVVAIIGDSVGELDAGGTVSPYPILIREKMRLKWGISGTGLRGVWTDDWSFTTGGNAWTASTNSNTWAKGPYNGLYEYANTMRASTSSMTATWTKPHWVRSSITSFKFHVVDGAGSANFSYRVDGGSWTNVTNTWSQDDSYDIINVATTVTSTVQIRGANAAGTSVNVYLIGIECITGTGATLHDITASGEGLYATARSGGAADLNAWIDAIQPKLIVVCYTNDLVNTFWNTTRITDDLQSIVDRQAPYGKVIPMPFWGQDRYADGPDDARNTELANIYTAAATASNSEYIDLWARYGNYAAVNALGFMADGLHPSDTGSIEIARVLWALLSRGTGNARFRS